MLPFFDDGKTTDYQTEVIGSVGRFNVSAIMRRSLALKALETPLSREDYNMFNNEAKKISLSCEFMKEGEHFPDGSYVFEEREDSNLSWLLRCTRAIAYAGKVHTGSFYTTDSRFREIKEEPIKGYLYFLRWDESHNIDAQKEADALKSMWLFWAEQVSEKFPR